MRTRIDVSDKEIISKSGSKASGVAEQLRGCHVLVVEDNEISLELVLALLEDIGVTSTAASDGQQALHALEEESFDAVLMDVQMPVMDGLAATREIRQQSKFADLPVIALTAGGIEMNNSQQQVLDAGMNDHIAKPINVNDMFSIMAKWIDPIGTTENQAARLEPSEIKEALALPEIGGINTKLGLGVCNGNLSLYLRLLTMFVKEVDFIDRFNVILATGDMATAQLMVHSLKGTAANIGAEQIEAVAQDLENVIKEGGMAEAIDLRQANLAKVLNPVVSTLQRFYATQQGDTAMVVVAPNVDLLSPLIRQLSALLSDNDTAAIEKIDDLKIHLEGSAYEGELARVVRRIEGYEFEAALIELRSLAGTIGVVV